MQDELSFGRWLQQRRQALDLTQAELARHVGVATNTIHKIETDARRPSKEVAQRMSRLLAIPVEEQAIFIRFARGESSTVQPTPLPVRVLNAPWQRSDGRAPGQPMPPTNLPQPLTSFIGREAEVEALQTRVRHADVRLLTLTGPGGIGKTRIALEVAGRLRGTFPDGVWFVNLAPVVEPAQVVWAIADTLGVKETGGQPVTTCLQTYLQSRHLLLVLDNFEQVVTGATLVSELLKTAPRVKILVTSRALLHLYGEHEFIVRPFALPPLVRTKKQDHRATEGALPIEKYAAVALFVQRARAAKPDFQVTAENAAAVAEICLHLDGLPLAIELAAVRIRLLPPRALLTRMNQRLKILTGGPHDAEPRQRTLRSTIDWSYTMLNAGEQVLLARIAVFVGSFPLEAAETVCASPDDPLIDIFESLVSLVNQNLLQSAEGPDEWDIDDSPRFVMLETINEYAQELLLASGDASRMQQRYADYYIAWAKEGEPKLRSADRKDWLRALDREYVNLRAVLDWTLGSIERTELGLELAGALGWFWYMSRRWSEGLHWLRQVLERPDAHVQTPGRAQALFAAAVLISFQQQAYTVARAWLEESVAIWRQSGDRSGLAYSLGMLGLEVLYHGDYVGACTYMDESITLWRDVRDAWGLAFGLNLQAMVLRVGGDRATARRILEESLANWRSVRDQWGITLTLNRSGEVAFDEGNYTQAGLFFTESLVLSRTLQNQEHCAWALEYLAHIAMQQDDYEQANRFYVESLSLHSTLGHHVGVVSCLAGLASVADRQGNIQRAARLGGAAETLSNGKIEWAAPAVRSFLQRAFASLQTPMSETDFAAMWLLGRAMTLEQAIAYALEERLDA